jgi:selenocysteine-specific elongation factor
MAVDVFIGASVVPARVRLLDADTLAPGDAGWAQLALTPPVAVAPQDRFVVRNPSPSETLGGGVVMDIQPRQHKRRQPDVVAHLAALAADDPEVRVRAVVQGAKGGDDLLALDDIVRQTRLSPEHVLAALDQLQATGDILQVGALVIASARWQLICQISSYVLRDYHNRFPLRQGMPLQEWRRQARNPKALMEYMRALDIIVIIQHSLGARSVTLVALPDFAPQMTPEQHAQLDAVLTRLAEDALNPPTASELARLATAEVIEAAIDAGKLVRIAPDLITSATSIELWQERIVAYLTTHERITIAEARDIIGGARRLIVPLLDYLDSCQITRWVGDSRMLGVRSLRTQQ